MTKPKSSKKRTAQRFKGFHGVDVAILSALIEKTDFNNEVASECTKRGFIPLRLSEALVVAKFVSRTVLAAQSAQREYNVPASVLIALALQQHSFDVDAFEDASVSLAVGTGSSGCRSLQILSWFMKTAEHLGTARKYHKARLLFADRRAAYGLPTLKEYVNLVCSIGLGSRLDADAEDVISNIETYDLYECDLAALRQSGEYNSETFTTYTDEQDARRLRLGWLDFVPMIHRPLSVESAVPLGLVV